MDLHCEVLPQLVLRDPFIVASSHWTSTENALRQIASVSPAALTLKTTSQIKGGDGIEAVGKKREWRYLVNAQGHRFGRYVDGPWTVEFWDIPTTFKMTQVARSLFADSKIGLSAYLQIIC
jgi:hypothetical protein